MKKVFFKYLKYKIHKVSVSFLLLAIIASLVISSCASPSKTNPVFTLEAAPLTIIKKVPKRILGESIPQQKEDYGTGEIKITILRENGFSSAIALDISGLPMGVDAKFSPNPVSGDSSILTLSLAKDTSLGTKQVTILGSSGDFKTKVVFTLTIKDGIPEFSMVASNIALKRGYSEHTFITIKRKLGFTAKVSLSVVGLPKGVTIESLSPNPTDGSSKLVLKASQSADLGPKVITIIGKSNGITQTSSFLLKTSAYPEIVAYAWAHNPTALSYMPNTSYSYNSAGDPITIKRIGTGKYLVHFPDLPLFAVNIQLTTLNSDSSCHNYLISGNDLGIQCNSRNGVPLNTRFNVQITDKNVSHTKARIIAYAWASNSKTLSYNPASEFSYNSSGGTITASRQVKGRYSIKFKGLNIKGSNIQVTAYGSNHKCGVIEWNNDTVKLACYDLQGNVVDSAYNIVVSKEVNVSSSTAEIIAYAWADQKRNPSYQPDLPSSYNASNGKISAKRESAGVYSITFAESKISSSIMIVSAQGNSGNCNIQSWVGFTVFVNCYDVNNKLSDSKYEILAVHK